MIICAMEMDYLRLAPVARVPRQEIESQIELYAERFD